MNDDDGLHGAASELASAPPGERERAIRAVCERIAAAAAAQRAAAQRAAAPVPGERRRDMPPPTQDSATLRSPPAWVAQPVPVAPAPGPAPVPGHAAAPPASLPPVVQAPAFLKSTAPLPDLSREALPKAGALPSRPAQPAPPPPPRRVAPKTVQSRVRGMGETTPAGDDSIQKAVAGLSSAVPSSRLTLRQYASLCAELALRPEHRREILERYQVRGEAEYAALDAYWRRERAARPETRAAFADDFARHQAWLHVHWA